MKRAAILGIGVAMAAACGEIVPPGASLAPMNQCSQQSDCERQLAGATCRDDICVVPGKLSYTLSVSIPATALHAPGQTFFFPPQYLNDLFLHQKVPSNCESQDARPVCNCTPPKCLFLPANGESQGTLRVGRGLAVEVWPWLGCGSSALSQKDRDQYCGLRPKDPKEQYTTLPSRVVFRPLWPVDTSYSFMTSVGITRQPDIDATILARPDVVPGPNNTIGTRYDVLLQAGPSDLGVGWYVLRMDPVSPFDSAFPPILQRVQVQGTQGATDFRTLTLDGFDAGPSARTFSLSTKGPSLTGWRVYLAARSTAAKKSFDMPMHDGERLSTVTTLANPAGETVALQTALNVDNVLGMRLVVEPPPNQALPVFAIDDVDGQILPANQEIPGLPAAVDVKGTVTLDGKGRPARVAFESLRDPDGAIELTDGSFSSVLSYRTIVETDATGAYSVHLPPGKYGAYVEPLAPDSAKTVITPFVVGSKEPVQQGRALALARKTHVRGTVELGDHRPVADADILFTPALQQPMGTNPLALPRPAHAQTVIANGAAAFDVDVDPGVYDITVAPLAGTRFPWLVKRASTIPQQANVMLELLTVSPPIQQGNVVPGLTIRDPYGTAVAGALVEVYAASELSMGTPLYLIGRAQTDANGHFDLYLAGPPK